MQLMIYKIGLLLLFTFRFFFDFVWDLVSRGFPRGMFPHLGLNYHRLGHFYQVLFSLLQSILLKYFSIPHPQLYVVLD